MRKNKIQPIQPDREDFEAVANQYGRPRSDEDAAHFYRLAQANKLIREAGLEAHLETDEPVDAA
jgi:hypothetical protein